MKIFSERVALYVDDEVLVALDGATALQDMGFADVVMAHTRDSALKLLSETPIDIAILDINLGRGETSFEIAARANELGVKVVFTTGYQVNDLPEFLRVHQILEKPVTTERLRTAMETTLRKDP